jgi:hypothetical protein
MLSGTLPPFSATFFITALCSAMFCSALPCAPGVDVQFLCEFLARVQRRIEVEELQQVHDRLAIVSAAALLRSHIAQHLVDVDVLQLLAALRGRLLRRRGCRCAPVS